MRVDQLKSDSMSDSMSAKSPVPLPPGFANFKFGSASTLRTPTASNNASGVMGPSPQSGSQPLPSSDPHLRIASTAFGQNDGDEFDFSQSASPAVTASPTKASTRFQRHLLKGVVGVKNGYLTMTGKTAYEGDGSQTLQAGDPNPRRSLKSPRQLFNEGAQGQNREKMTIGKSANPGDLIDLTDVSERPSRPSSPGPSSGGPGPKAKAKGKAKPKPKSSRAKEGAHKRAAAGSPGGPGTQPHQPDWDTESDGQESGLVAVVPQGLIDRTSKPGTLSKSSSNGWSSTEGKSNREGEHHTAVSPEPEAAVVGRASHSSHASHKSRTSSYSCGTNGEFRINIVQPLPSPGSDGKREHPWAKGRPDIEDLDGGAENGVLGGRGDGQDPLMDTYSLDLVADTSMGNLGRGRREFDAEAAARKAGVQNPEASLRYSI